MSDAKDYQDSPPPDTEVIIDANPMAIALDGAFPTTVEEGAGDGASGLSSRAAVLQLHGDNFLPTATVTFTPASAVQLVETKVAADHKFIAIAVKVPVDPACAPPTMKPIKVTVSEPDGVGGTAMASLDAAFAVTCLNELTTVLSPQPSGMLDPKYSKVDVATGITFKADTAETPAALLRSASYIKVAGAIVASASGQNSGPGGGRGGAGGNPGAAGGGPGAGGGGAGGLAGAGGGGAGFATGGGAGSGTGAGGGGAMTGDSLIASYATNRPSGGGGGGNSTLGGGGGAGGGGGGIVEVTANGDVSIGDITATGGSSAKGGGDGGAGAGGTIVVRTRGALAIGNLTVAAGTPPSGGNGGTSSVGRIRIDATMQVAAPANGRIGPMFVDAPTTTSTYPTLTLRGEPNDHSSLLEVLDKDGNIVDNSHLYTPAFGPNGTAMVMPVLKIGYNRVCVLVAGNQDPNVAEGANCVEIGYAP